MIIESFNLDLELVNNQLTVNSIGITTLYNDHLEKLRNEISNGDMGVLDDLLEASDEMYSDLKINNTELCYRTIKCILDNKIHINDYTIKYRNSHVYGHIHIISEKHLVFFERNLLKAYPLGDTLNKLIDYLDIHKIELDEFMDFNIDLDNTFDIVKSVEADINIYGKIAIIEYSNSLLGIVPLQTCLCSHDILNNNEIICGLFKIDKGQLIYISVNKIKHMLKFNDREDSLLSYRTNL